MLPESKPQTFGKYFLLRQLATGSTAEVFLAQRRGAEDGPVQLLALKSLSSSLAGDAKGQDAFRRESQLAIRLQHPNIVKVVECDVAEDRPYIAMEYVRGRTLRQFLRRLEEMGMKGVPVDIACHIACEVASGLVYAHNFEDKIQERKLQVVHHDLSPRNILLSYDGAVKLFDFGTAKLQSVGGSGDAQPVDASGDLDALGRMLTEMLGQQFIPGSGQLEGIIARLVAKSPSHRCDAGEAQYELRRFLYQHYPRFNPVDLAQLAQRIFAAEIRDEARQLQSSIQGKPLVERSKRKGSYKVKEIVSREHLALLAGGIALIVAAAYFLPGLAKYRKESIGFVDPRVPGETPEKTATPPLANSGYLNFVTDPPAEVTITGQGRPPWKARTPLKHMELPVGIYEAEIRHPQTNAISKYNFVIEANQDSNLDIDH